MYVMPSCCICACLQLGPSGDPAAVPADVITAVADALEGSAVLDVNAEKTRIRRKAVRFPRLWNEPT